MASTLVSADRTAHSTQSPRTPTPSDQNEEVEEKIGQNIVAETAEVDTEIFIHGPRLLALAVSLMLAMFIVSLDNVS